MNKSHAILLTVWLAMAPAWLAAQTTLVDNFERTLLGPDWAADASYQIVSGTLDNTDVDPAWKYYAIYLPLINPTEVSFKWTAGTNLEGASSGGVILRYDRTAQNGYFILRRYGDLTLHPIIGGIIKRDEITIDSAPPNLAYPKAGDVIKVVTTSDASGHHFSLYINNQLDGKLNDVAKTYGNGATLYGGVALYGQRTNNIDDFTVKGTLPPTPIESITVMAPNGGESWNANSVQTITWTTANFTGDIKIELSTDGGLTYTSVASGEANDGAYSWNVPTSTSTTCRIRISDSADGSPMDVSNSNFTIAPQPFDMTVTAPNGGEVYYQGSVRTITWTTSMPGGNVKIELSQNGGTSYTTVIASTPNTGSYSWTVPVVTSTQCRIRVADLDGDPVDVSNANFTIAVTPPDLAVTRPNGGETWYAGTQQEIRWVGPGVLNMPSVTIRYSIDGGSTWTDIIASTENDGSYLWTVPAQLTTQALIRIVETGGPAFDQSNGVFTIAAQVLLRVNNSSGQPGTTNNRVTISLDNTINLRGFSFRLTDSPNLLTAMNVTPINRAASFAVTKVDNGTSLTVYLVHLSGSLLPAGSGPVLQISYDVSGGALSGDYSDLAFSEVDVADANSLPVLPVLQDGKFYFVIKGDLDGDGSVTALDIERGVQLLLGLGLPMAPEELLAGDLDTDGDFDFFDFMNVWEMVY